MRRTTFARITILAAFMLVVAACAAPDPPAAEGTAAPEAEGETTTTLDVTTSTAPEDADHEDTHGVSDHEDSDTGHDEAEAGHEDGVAVAEEGSADRTIEVTMTEFAFDPATIEVSAGETIEFVLVNQGQIEHEFRLTDQHGVEDHLEGGHEDHGDDSGEDDTSKVLVPAGETRTLTVSFSEESQIDLYACLLPGHYEAGMKGDLQLETS